MIIVIIIIVNIYFVKRPFHLQRLKALLRIVSGQMFMVYIVKKILSETQCFQLFLEVLHIISSLDVIGELIPKV